MKHAREKTLTKIQRHLEEVRRRMELKERKPGAFYRKGEALLHFHDDPEGTFADLKAKGDWVRFRVESEAEWKALMNALDKTLVPTSKK